MRPSERLGIAISVVCLGLLYAFNFSLPSHQIAFRLFRTDLRWNVSGTTQMALLLAATISLGVDATMRRHAWHGQRSLLYTATYWPPTALITLGVLIMLPSITRWAFQLAWVLLAGSVLTFVIYLQYQAVDDQGQVRRVPRILLNMLAFALALLGFSYLYSTEASIIAQAVSILGLSGALALGLLCDAHVNLGRIWLYAGIIGVSMGELALVLSYLALDARISGPFLLLAFYALIGLGQQHLWQRLDRRTVIEYLLVAVAGLVLLGLLIS